MSEMGPELQKIRKDAAIEISFGDEEAGIKFIQGFNTCFKAMRELYKPQYAGYTTLELTQMIAKYNETHVPVSQVEKLVEALKTHTLNPSYGDSNWMYALREMLDEAYDQFRKQAK